MTAHLQTTGTMYQNHTTAALQKNSSRDPVTAAQYETHPLIVCNKIVLCRLCWAGLCSGYPVVGRCRLISMSQWGRPCCQITGGREVAFAVQPSVIHRSIHPSTWREVEMLTQLLWNLFCIIEPLFPATAQAPRCCPCWCPQYSRSTASRP